MRTDMARKMIIVPNFDATFKYQSIEIFIFTFDTFQNQFSKIGRLLQFSPPAAVIGNLHS